MQLRCNSGIIIVVRRLYFMFVYMDSTDFPEMNFLNHFFFSANETDYKTNYDLSTSFFCLLLQ